MQNELTNIYHKKSIKHTQAPPPHPHTQTHSHIDTHTPTWSSCAQYPVVEFSTPTRLKAFFTKVVGLGTRTDDDLNLLSLLTTKKGFTYWGLRGAM